jgi:adenosyl cobinamide kinase/adenosyl cobinamide phosphate guanylyltransferase
MPAISSLPGIARWSAQKIPVCSTLEDMRDQMQDYFDDRTERWQESDRGQAMIQRLEEIEEIIALVDSLNVN